MSDTMFVMAAQPGGAATPTSFTPRILSSPVGYLPWADTHPIATASREQALVAELAERSTSVAARHTRSHVTALLNCLRGGLTLDELLAQAPGFEPARLFGAYVAIDQRRQEAADAWSQIVADPSEETLNAGGELAGLLVPVLVNRLRVAASIDPTVLHHIAGELAATVETVRASVERVEAELDCCSDSETAIALSHQLYDRSADSLFGSSCYVPRRVGDLIPTRVAALLGERPVAAPSRRVG